MNYLAHIALSGPVPEIIMGNFCGDYIKGKLDSEQKRSLSVNFLNGVRLHRFIDNFTDTDKTVREMIKEVCQIYGRAAPVVTDISFDHFLANRFSQFHDKDLRHFVSEFYDLYKTHVDIVPEEMKPFAETLISNDWLYKYREWGTVERTLLSMGKRYPFLSDLLNPPDLMRRNLAIYDEYFAEFYPRLQQASAEYLQVLTAN